MIPRAYTIPLKVAEAGAIIFPGFSVGFDDVDDLRGKPIVGIMLATGTEVREGPGLGAVIRSREYCLTMCDDQGRIRHKDVPATSLMSKDNDGVVKYWEPFVPNWDRCYVVFTSADVPGDPVEIPFTILYLDE